MAELLSISVVEPKGLDTRITGVFDRAMTIAEKDVGKILYDATVRELTRRHHKASNDLISSLHTELGGSKINSLVSLVTYDIAANALEYGTQPVDEDAGFVNIDAILSWIDDKGINPREGSKKSLAFLIARKIGRLGMTVDGKVVKSAPKRPFNAAQKRAKPLIENYWRTVVANVVGEMNRL